MNYWKPIVASLVIFISGLVSGVIITKSLVSNPGSGPTEDVDPRPWENRWFVGRLERELKLTPEQRTQIEQLLEKSQQDLGSLFDPVVDQARQINVKLREDMRAVMTPEQVEEYDRLMSRPPRGRGGPGGSRGGGGPRGGGPGDGFGGGERGGNRGDFDGRGERGDFGRRDGDRQSNRSDRGNRSSTNSSEVLTEINEEAAQSTPNVSEETGAPTN